MTMAAARARDGLRVVSPDSPMLERGAEVGALVVAFARARESRGSVAVIEAAWGLGKSRLLMEARRLASKGGMEVLAATARGLERNFSLGVARQLFESRVARAGSRERERLFAGPAGLAAPVLAEGFSEPARTEAEDPVLAIVHGLYWLCSKLGEARPLVLVVDDAEWADEASLRFLLYLGRRIRELPVVLVVAVGTGDPRSSMLRELVADPASTVLRLRPLSAEAAARHLYATVWRRGEEAFMAAVLRATGGNPFLLQELVTELVRADVPPTAASAESVGRVAPASIAEAVLLRLRRAGAGAVDLGRAVAVLGEAELRHAARLAELEQPEAARLADVLVSAGVFRSGDLLAFAQPIVQAAIHAHTSEVERAEKHLRAAQLLDREGSPAEDVAQHLLEARRAADPRAVELLHNAAERALARGAAASAVRLFRRALREPPVPEMRARVILELGRAEAVAGDAEAVEHLSDAAKLIEDKCDRALTELDVGRILYAQGRQRDSVRVLDRSLNDLSDGDGEVRVLLRAARAVAAGTSLPLEELQSAARANGGFERDGIATTPTARLLLAHLAYELALRGENAPDVRRLARGALADGALKDERSEMLGYYRAVAALVMVEDLQTAGLALTAAVDEARARGSVFCFATASYLRACAALRQGHVDDAATDAQNALAARRYGWRISAAGAHAVLARSFIERADMAGAAREIDRGGREQSLVDQSLPLYLAAAGHLRLLGGHPKEALDAYLECGRQLTERGAVGPGVVAWRSQAALASARVGNVPDARWMLDDELERARRFGVPGSIGRSLHAIAQTDAPARALERLAEAVDVFEHSEATLDRARALVDFGAALRRAGKRREARDPLRRGLELAEGCGARALADRARSEIAAAGGRPRRMALSGVEALTPREREVAGLARDMSNREIAEALFVTLKTVEWHLRQAFVKLGVSSRRELRAALAGAEDRHP